MSVTRITRTSLPDHDGTDILVYSPTGEYLGRMVFDKHTSRLELAPGQLPHRRMVSKRKHRGQ